MIGSIITPMLVAAGVAAGATMGVVLHAYNVHVDHILLEIDTPYAETS